MEMLGCLSVLVVLQGQDGMKTVLEAQDICSGSSCAFSQMRVHTEAQSLVLFGSGDFEGIKEETDDGWLHLGLET